ncbi:MAG: hypothetical protein ACKVPY_16395 [Paracoccaceae bacterium]
MTDFAMPDALAAGAERIVVVITESKMAIRDYLPGGPRGAEAARFRASARESNHGGRPEVAYVSQDGPLGLDHAVLYCAGPTLPALIAVVLPDDVITGTECLSGMAGR